MPGTDVDHNVQLRRPLTVCAGLCQLMYWHVAREINRNKSLTAHAHRQIGGMMVPKRLAIQKVLHPVRIADDS